MRSVGRKQKISFPTRSQKEIVADPEAPEVMQWQQEEQGDELSQDRAPSVETDSTRLP